MTFYNITKTRIATSLLIALTATGNCGFANPGDPFSGTSGKRKHTEVIDLTGDSDDNSDNQVTIGTKRARPNTDIVTNFSTPTQNARHASSIIPTSVPRKSDSVDTPPSLPKTPASFSHRDTDPSQKSPQELNDLAKNFLNGTGVARAVDEKKALELFTKARSKGDDSENLLAGKTSLRHKEHWRRGEELLKELIRNNAGSDEEVSDAQFTLGLHLMTNGLSVQEKGQGMKHVIDAADYGHLPAIEFLGERYLLNNDTTNYGMKKDINSGMSYLMLADKRGSVKARNIALKYIQESLAKPEGSQDWKIANLHDAYCKLTKEFGYAHDVNAGLEQLKELSNRGYRKADDAMYRYLTIKSNAGHAGSKFLLGKFMYENKYNASRVLKTPSPMLRHKGLELIIESASAGSKKGAYYLRKLATNGLIKAENILRQLAESDIEASRKQYFVFLQKGAEQSDARRTFLLGQALIEGKFSFGDYLEPSTDLRLLGVTLVTQSFANGCADAIKYLSDHLPRL